MKHILFVCKYNRFRSKSAEAIFNKLNKNKSVTSKSAGLIRGSNITKEILDSCKELGYNIKGKPQGVSTDLLKWQDTIIVVANDVPASLFKNNKKYGKKLIVWKIPDTNSNNKTAMKKIITQIESRIIKLIEKLNDNHKN